MPIFFLKSGVPFVEDLGSTNGTFVAGKRLDEHAVALTDGDSIAFGGHYFVYNVSLQKEESEVDPTVTKFSPAAAEHTGDVDKTTFVGAAGSFLDIFCVEHAQQQDDEVNNEALQQADDARKETDQPQVRGKFVIFISELTEALAGSNRKGIRHAFWWGTALAAVLGIVGLLLYHSGGSERELKNLMASGDYGRATTAANQYLERDPDNAEVKALSTEALLKANVPQWLTMLKAREFDRASAALTNMKKTQHA
ncbi:FHA domain-containing protein [Undibacterium arcticum]